MNLHIDILDKHFEEIKSGFECQSSDVYLYGKATVLECADACRQRIGCIYFIYGYGSKQGQCYWEKAASDDCSEGWEVDEYNFYKIIGMFRYGF